MNTFKQSLMLVKKHRQRKKLINIDNPKYDNIYNKVFHSLINKEFNSDNAIAEKFFNCSPIDPKYKMFKSRFKNEIGLLALNFDMEDKRQKHIYREEVKSYQKLTLLQMYILNGYREEAYIIAKSLALKANQYNLLLIEAECYNSLAHISILSKNKKALDIYKNKFEKALNEYYTLNKAYLLKEDIVELLNKEEKIKSLVLEKINELNDYYESTKNPEILVYKNAVLVIFYLKKKDFIKCIELCNETLNFISKHVFLKGFSKEIIFESNKMIAYSELNNFKSAEISIQKCIKLLPPKNRNEIYFLYMNISICFNQLNFNKILDIYKKILSNPFYNLEKDVYKEFLGLIEGYLAFIYNQKIITLKDKTVFNNIKNFNIDTFYKNATISRSDKKLKHVSILILQVLFFLQSNRFDDLTKKMETLAKYKNRYLNKKEHQRFHIFLKLISLIEKRYNPNDLSSIKRIKNKSNLLLQSMKTHNIKFNEKLEPYEIIPFEFLWEEVMKILVKNTGIKQ